MSATVKNRGPKNAHIALDTIPLLYLTRIDGKAENAISSLPYRKIECKPDSPSHVS